MKSTQQNCSMTQLQYAEHVVICSFTANLLHKKATTQIGAQPHPIYSKEPRGSDQETFEDVHNKIAFSFYLLSGLSLMRLNKDK